MMATKEDITFDQYRAKEAVNFSSLKILAKSPRKYRYYLDNGIEPTDAMRLGRGTHTAILEPQRFLLEYALWPEKQKDGKANVRRGKKWDAFQAVNEDKTILTEKQYMLALEMAKAVRAEPTAKPFIDCKGEEEVSFTWAHRLGFTCKCRVDWVTDAAIVDMKSSQDATPRGFGRQCANYGYHMQAAFYQDAVRAVTGKTLPVVFIAVEKCAPFEVVCYETPLYVLQAGRLEYEELLVKLKECHERNEWPGINGGRVLELEPPAWGLGGDDDLITEESEDNDTDETEAAE
jgi:hypothetical protein